MGGGGVGLYEDSNPGLQNGIGKSSVSTMPGFRTIELSTRPPCQ